MKTLPAALLITLLLIACGAPEPGLAPESGAALAGAPGSAPAGRRPSARSIAASARSRSSASRACAATLVSISSRAFLPPLDTVHDLGEVVEAHRPRQ